MSVQILKGSGDDVKNIAEVFKTYFEKLEYTNFSGAYPYETEKIIKNLKTRVAETDIFKADLFSAPPTVFNKKESETFITDVFKYYSSIKDSYYKLKYVYGLFVNYKPESSSSMSSFSSSTGYDYNAAMKVYEQVISKWESFNEYMESMAIENILSEVLENAMALASNDEKLYLLKHIEKIYDSRSGLNIIDLYGNVLRKVLENTTRVNKPLVQYVSQLIEDLKQSILPPVPRSTSNRKPTLQTLVQRYRLIPDGPSRSFSKVINELTGVKVSDKKPLESLPKVCKHISNKVRKYGFIVISKRIPAPVENNIWLLTDANYLQTNNLLTLPGAGVSHTTLARTKTIYKMNTDGKPLEDGIYYINGEFANENYYYFLETLDGVNFRIMYPWYISIFGKKIYEVPEHMVPDLKAKDKSPSTRVEAYNEILNNEIMSHLHKPYTQQEDLSRLERKQVEIKWNVARKKIARGMLEDYRDLFDNNKVSKDTVLGLITHPDIFSNSLKYIIQSLSLRPMPENHMVEVYMSSLKSLNEIKKKMGRDVADIYKENYQTKVLKMLEGGSSVHNTIKIIDILEDVLMAMLEIHISEKSNVYSIIQQKIDLVEAIAYADQ